MASVGGRAETLTSVHSTLRESFQASDHAESHQIPRSLARVSLAAVLDGERSSTADRNVVRTLIDIIRAEEALANHPIPNQLANKRTWKSFKEMLRLRRNTSNPTCSLHSQNTVAQFPQVQILSQNSLGDLLGNGSSSVDVLPSDTDQRRRSIRLSDALAAERDETRSNNGDVNVGGGDQSVEEEPIRMSLMDLLEETERQARLQGPPMYRFDGDKESGEDGDDKMEVEQEEKGGGAVSCCVCMVRHKGAAFIPCGHTFCRMCSRELWVQRGSSTARFPGAFMAQSRIPEYGTWKDGGSHDFTITFEKGRTFKYGGPTMNQDMLPTEPEPTDAKTDSSEPPILDQDLGSTPPPETREDSEARKARQGVPPKANKINPHNGGHNASSGDAFTDPQGKKLDGLSVKKTPLHPRVEAKVQRWKHQSQTPEDGAPNVTPPVPPFGVWDESQNFSDIFKKNQRGNVDVTDNPDPPRLPTKKPKKGGCWKWLCGPYYL